MSLVAIPAQLLAPLERLSATSAPFIARLIATLGGPRNARLLTVSLAVAYFGMRIAALFTVPRHLRHLPILNASQVIHFLVRNGGSGAKGGYLQRHHEQMVVLRAEAVAKGTLSARDASRGDTPAVWASWLLGKYAINVANPEDMKAMLTQHDLYDKVDMSKLGLISSRELLGQNVALAPMHAWKHQRKVVNPAFRRGWATSLFAHPTFPLLHKFDDLADRGADVDISAWMGRLTLDALSTVGFGANFDSIGNPDSRLVTLYHQVMGTLVAPVGFMFGRLANYFPSQIRAVGRIREFNGYILDMINAKTKAIAARRSRGEMQDEGAEDTRDLLELMIDAAESGATTIEELRANTVIFFIAGHDTTANALTFAMYLLGQYPEVQRKARAEVLAATGDAAMGTAVEDLPYPTNDQQQKEMPYLTMIIKETMRLFPPLAQVPFRITTREAKLADGTVLPQGSLVSGHILAVQRSTAVWGPDANEFRPERWESSVSDTLTADGGVPLHPSAHNYSWTPFGGGQRICLGQQFSLIEQRVVLALMLVRYEWTVAGNADAVAGEPTTVPGTLLHPIDIQLRMKRRN
ncbi:cytochrome P450 [Blastocladiella britannica]|nr:cytochrome P450 [Blastocladiella britannica]